MGTIYEDQQDKIFELRQEFNLLLVEKKEREEQERHLEDELEFERNALVTDGQGAVNAGGDSNEAPGSESVVNGGQNNKAAGSASVSGGGKNNEVIGTSAVVGGGERNTVESDTTSIGGGLNNESKGRVSFIGGGEQNVMEGQFSVIGGGSTNKMGKNGVKTCIGGGKKKQRELRIQLHCRW